MAAFTGARCFSYSYFGTAAARWALRPSEPPFSNAIERNSLRMAITGTSQHGILTFLPSASIL